MNKELHSIFMLNQNPMLGIKDNKIAVYNPAAEELLGHLYTGKSAVGLVPDALLLYNQNSFAASVDIDTQQYSVTASHIDEWLVLAFSEISSKNCNNNLINDTLISGMLSTLCNEKLSIKLIIDSFDGKLTENQRRYFSFLYHNYFSLQHSIGNLSTALALSNGTLDCSYVEVDLAQLCSDLVSTVSYVLRERDVALDFSTEIGEMIVYMDAPKIERLILNLLSNSFAHTLPNGRVSIALTTQGNNAVITITDNGCGIEPEVMQTIFSSYEKRGNFSLLGKTTGAGLGLGIASGIAQIHRGSLIIESRPGKGTTVRVLLPFGDHDLIRFSNNTERYVSTEIGQILTELSSLISEKYYDPEHID